MKIKIDDKKIIYLNVIVFSKKDSTVIEVNQSTQKDATDPMDAIVKSRMNLQRKHIGVKILAESTMNLTPDMFLDEQKGKIKIIN